jgi:hypothetical protein
MVAMMAPESYCVHAILLSSQQIQTHPLPMILALQVASYICTGSQHLHVKDSHHLLFFYATSLWLTTLLTEIYNLLAYMTIPQTNLLQPSLK